MGFRVVKRRLKLSDPYLIANLTESAWWLWDFPSERKDHCRLPQQPDVAFVLRLPLWNAGSLPLHVIVPIVGPNTACGLPNCLNSIFQKAIRQKR